MNFNGSPGLERVSFAGFYVVFKRKRVSSLLFSWFSGSSGFILYRIMGEEIYFTTRWSGLGPRVSRIFQVNKVLYEPFYSIIPVEHPSAFL